MSKQLLLKMQLAEARGEIPEGTAASAMYATVAEAGVRAALGGYYGHEAINAAMSNAKAEQMALDISDEIVADVAPLMRSLQATHTTSDFPLALGQLRSRRVKEAFQAQESNWRDFATVTSTPDFKPIRALRMNGIPELLPRPEGTDVQYASFGETEEGYRVANLERAVKYTWESHLNDDVGLFTRQLEALGKGARITEQVVVFSAIRDGLARTPLTAGIGAPAIERLTEMEQALAARSFNTGEAQVAYGFMLTDLIIGTAERIAVNQILNTQFTDYQGGTPNPMQGAFQSHVEPMWARVMGRDYVGYDRNAEWIEVAFLRGFENGPRTYVKLPDEQNFADEGSFSDHSLHVKVGHSLGAKVTLPEAAIRVQGA